MGNSNYNEACAHGPQAVATEIRLLLLQRDRQGSAIIIEPCAGGGIAPGT